MDAPNSFESDAGTTAGGGRLKLGCFKTHTAAIPMAQKLGIQEKWWVLAMVSLVFTCEWVDRALLNVALEPMKVSLALSDTQVGAIASSSYWVAVVSVLPIGRFADMTSRRDTISVALCIWAFGTVLTGFAVRFAAQKQKHLSFPFTFPLPPLAFASHLGLNLGEKRLIPGHILRGLHGAHGRWPRHRRILPCDGSIHRGFL